MINRRIFGSLLHTSRPGKENVVTNFHSGWFRDSIMRLLLGALHLLYLPTCRNKRVDIYVSVTILINRQAIVQKEYVKYLGVLIDSKLTFKYHIAAISKKISRAVGMMYKLRPFVDKKLLKLIYYTLVYPFVTYALPLIGTADCKYLNSIHILQKRIVRLITYNDDMPDVAGPLSHSLPLFKELEMLTIFDLFKVETSKFVFDCLFFC